MSHDRTGVRDGSEVQTLSRLEDIPDPTPDGSFVMVDVIISSTSIVRLLEAGAQYVKPFADIDDALAFGNDTENAVLIGEQEGRAIDGFDSGPLPSVLATLDLDGCPVGILTSNGTRAVEKIGRDQEIFIASTVNAAAVASALNYHENEPWLVAAGRGGDPTPEDSAGVELVDHLYADTLTAEVEERIKEEIYNSGTAQWLSNLGLEQEVEELLRFDSSDTVPRMKDGVFISG